MAYMGWESSAGLVGILSRWGGLHPHGIVARGRGLWVCCVFGSCDLVGCWVAGGDAGPWLVGVGSFGFRCPTSARS